MGADTLQLAVAEKGSGLPLVLLHVFAHTARTWGAAEKVLAEHCRVLAVDLPGHGCTGVQEAALPYTFERCATALRIVLDERAIERAVILGYSLGGRVALHFARAHPERCRALIVESASPGLRDEGARAARRAADERLAARIERLGVQAFLEEWEALPLFAGLRRLSVEQRAALRRERLVNTARGLAESLRGMSVGIQESLWEAVSGFTFPVLALAGAEDVHYVTVAAELVERVPRGRCVVVEQSGHTVHLEAPTAFTVAVDAFLVEVVERETAASGKE